MRHSKILAIILSCVFFTQVSLAQQLSVLKNDLMIGDQVTIMLSVDSSLGYQDVIFPKLKDSIGKFELIGEPNRTRFSETYTITCFDSGRYNVGPFIITMVGKNGDTTSQQTNQIGIKVATIDADTSKSFKPIDELAQEVKPTMLTRAKINIEENKWEYIAALALILLAAGLFWYLRKRKKKIIRPTEPAYQKAIRLLEELEEKKYWSRGEEKAYYVQLSDIVRDYLDERFKLNANELSTRELLNRVKKTGDLRKIHTELRGLLQTSDLVKFAKGLPSEQERAEAAKSARIVVEKTKPEEEVLPRDK